MVRVRVLGERISSPPGHVIVRGLLPGHGLFPAAAAATDPPYFDEGAGVPKF